MQAVLPRLLPVTRRDEMPQRIFVAVGCDLRITCSATGKHHEQQIITLRALSVFRNISGTEHAELAVEIVPAFPGAVYH